MSIHRQPTVNTGRVLFKSAWNNVFTQLFHVEVHSVFRHSGTIGGVQGNGTFGLSVKTLHERNLFETRS